MLVRDRLSGRRGTLIRSVGSAVSGLAVAFAFPPFDLPWLMPFGLAGLMLTVGMRQSLIAQQLLRFGDDAGVHSGIRNICIGDF